MRLSADLPVSESSRELSASVTQHPHITTIQNIFRPCSGARASHPHIIWNVPGRGEPGQAYDFLNATAFSAYDSDQMIPTPFLSGKLGET